MRGVDELVQQDCPEAHATRLQEVQRMCSVIEELERVCKEKDTSLGACHHSCVCALRFVRLCVCVCVHAFHHMRACPVAHLHVAGRRKRV